MKRISTIIAAALCVLTLSACGEKAEDVKASEEKPQASPEIEAEPMPDSMLYYGEVLEINKNEDGSLKSLFMNSQAKGELVMNIGEETVFVDSGNFTADTSEINVGDRMYVFHSPVMTMSLPGQSPALAIVRNIPMDARCAMYHEIEEISESGENLVITTDNGAMHITVTPETELSFYAGGEAQREDIESGKHMMVIYEELMNQAPQDPNAFKIMLFP